MLAETIPRSTDWTVPINLRDFKIQVQDPVEDQDLLMRITRRSQNLPLVCDLEPHLIRH